MPLTNPTNTRIITTADKIFAQLQHAIVEGEIRAGSKLSEPELAKHYQVSRSTLREALNRLKKCQLTERTANIGSRVVTCSMQTMLQQHAAQPGLKNGRAYYQEEGDLDFHYKVIMGSHNQQLINLICE